MKMKNIKSLAALLPFVSVLITAIFTVCYWKYETDSLPKRIENNQSRIEVTEKRITELEKSIAAQSTKTDMILQAVYEIRGVMMKK